MAGARVGELPSGHTVSTATLPVRRASLPLFHRRAQRLPPRCERSNRGVVQSARLALRCHRRRGSWPFTNSDVLHIQPQLMQSTAEQPVFTAEVAPSRAEQAQDRAEQRMTARAEEGGPSPAAAAYVWHSKGAGDPEGEQPTRQPGKESSEQPSGTHAMEWLINTFTAPLRLLEGKETAVHSAQDASKCEVRCHELGGDGRVFASHFSLVAPLKSVQLGVAEQFSVREEQLRLLLDGRRLTAVELNLQLHDLCNAGSNVLVLQALIVH